MRSVVQVYLDPPDLEKRIEKKNKKKGTRRMPRRLEAKKDAVSCEKVRGAASEQRSGHIRMGQPNVGKATLSERKRNPVN